MLFNPVDLISLKEYWIDKKLHPKEYEHISDFINKLLELQTFGLNKVEKSPAISKALGKYFFKQNRLYLQALKIKKFFT